MLSLKKLNHIYYGMIVFLALTIVTATFIPLPAGRDVSHAQTSNPPQIRHFTTDLETITPDEAESGESLTTLSWETTGVTEDNRLMLDIYVLGEWQPALEPDSILEPSGSLEVVIPHTLDFQAPTWRLAIVDTEDDTTILDSEELTLPYAVDEDTEPEITLFQTDVEELNINDLNRGRVMLPVHWAVVNRVPNSNLQFVQVYKAGLNQNVENIELPRDFEWVRSQSDGLVAPIMPPGSTFVSSITLRLQVVDHDDPTIIYTYEDLSVPVVGRLAQSAVPPTVIQTPNATAEVVADGNATCQAEFFFEEPGREYALNGGGTLNWIPFNLLCPTSIVHTSQAVFQMYQNGIMLWKAAPESVVYILTNDGLGISIPSLYTGEVVVINETPPSGITVLPDGVLGEAWSRRRDLTQTLGWPIDYPQTYETSFQEGRGGEIEGMVLSLPSGRRFFVRYGTVGLRPLTWAWVNATN